jgi:hypothetical protein
MESFDKELAEIQHVFYEIVSELLMKDASVAVKRVLLAVRTTPCSPLLGLFDVMVAVVVVRSAGSF